MPLPPNLINKRHSDWPFPFSYIPRRLTAFDWGKPKLWKGNLKPDDKIPTFHRDGGEAFAWVEFSPKPITSPKTWQISHYPEAKGLWKLAAWYVAYSFPRGKDGKFHQIRLGSRWDNVDSYVNFPTFPTTRKYTGDDWQDTKSW